MSTEAEALGERIAEMAAHLDAAKHGLLTDLREYDRSGTWNTQGFRSCSDWLSYRVGWSLGTARDHLRVAQRLGDLPLIDDALRTGEVSYCKVRAMTRVATPANEAMLLEDARHATGQQLELICRKYAMVVRAAKEVDEDYDRQRRTVSRRDLEDGMVRIEATLHPEEAALVWAALDRIAKERAMHAKLGVDATESPASSQDSTASTEATEAPAPRGAFSRADAFVAMAQSVVRGDSPQRSPVELVVTVAADVLRTSATGCGSAETRCAPFTVIEATPSHAAAYRSSVSAETRGAPIAVVEATPSHAAAGPAVVSAETRGAPISEVEAVASHASNDPERVSAETRGASFTVIEATASHAAAGRADVSAETRGAPFAVVEATASLAAAGRADVSAETRGASFTVIEATASHAAAGRADVSAETRGAPFAVVEATASLAAAGRADVSAETRGAPFTVIEATASHAAAGRADVSAETRGAPFAVVEATASLAAAGRADVSAETRGAPFAVVEATASHAAAGRADVSAETRGAPFTVVEAGALNAAAGPAGVSAETMLAAASEYRTGISAETSSGPFAGFAHESLVSPPPPAPIAVFADGTCVSAETARRLACDCGIVHMTEDANGTPLSVGRKTRSIPGAIKKAMLKRDRCCRFPGCSNRLYVEGHHLEHWMNGGETALHNLLGLCSFHHRFVHEYGYRLELDATQRPRFFDRSGREVLEVPDSPKPARLGWSAIADLNKDLAVDADTNECLWDGARPHYGDIIDALVRIDHLE